MIRTMKTSLLSRWGGLSATLIAVFVAAEARSATVGTIFGTYGGFEAPNSTVFLGSGQLEGQNGTVANASTTTQWKRSIGANLATIKVQNTMVQSGSQAVQFTTPQAISNDRIGLHDVGWPSTGLRYICIDWDMKLGAKTTSGGFGPYFGVEAYDDNGVAVSRTTSLGADAESGFVVYQNGVGQPVSAGNAPLVAGWHHFSMILDYAVGSHLTDLYVDGGFIATVPFIDDPGGNTLNSFTDAPMFALSLGPAGSPEASQAGTAYFDNYIVRNSDVYLCGVPEPTALGLTGIGLLVGCYRRRLAA